MIAAEIMTENPRTVRATDPLADAIGALQALGVRHLPVVDDDGDLVGMLSDRDLGSLMSTPTTGADDARMTPALASRPVADFMSADPIWVSPDADVAEIIDAMLESNVGAVPVVDGDGSVVGIVSYVDVLRALRPTNDESAPRRGRTPARPLPRQVVALVRADGRRRRFDEADLVLLLDRRRLARRHGGDDPDVRRSG